jgi:pyrroloquinoline quinone biosynthesis protein E
MPPAEPLLLIAELTYRCPLHCPYCSNPLDCGSSAYREELTTEQWARVFHEASALGVLQLAFTGGEPMARADLEQLTAAARDAGVYSTLVTSAVPFPARRVEALRDAGLDHVQISFQDADPTSGDRIAGRTCFARKREAARLVVSLGLPLTINVVLHRHNLDRVRHIIALAEELGARRLELANAQYHGWATVNRAWLMPERRQVEAAEQAVVEARDRLGPSMQILWVLPDYYEQFPKPCMGGWGNEAIVVTPDGNALPCHSAATLPDLKFENVRARSLADIWFNSSAFNRFRGIDWMTSPCRECPLGRQHTDFGGCRCQAFHLTGRADAADPTCHLSPQHRVVRDARFSSKSVRNGFVPRTTAQGKVTRCDIPTSRH